LAATNQGKVKKKLSFSSALVNKTVDKTTLNTCFIFFQKIFNILKEHIVFSTHYTKQGKKNSGEEVVSIKGLIESIR
jgi:hypothetical protein